MRRRRLVSCMLAGGSLLASAGCGVTYRPPELAGFGDIRWDADRLQCLRDTADYAIAACTRVIERPDPSAMFGSSWAWVYRSRAATALRLAGHLLSMDRDDEAVGAATTSLALLQRYDAHRPRVNVMTLPPERASIDKQTRELKLDRAQINYIAGIALVRVRRWEAAMKHLADAVELNPGHPGAWAALGVAANQMGRYDESRRDFEKVLSLDADYFTDSKGIQRLISEASKHDDTYRLGEVPPRRRPVGCATVPPTQVKRFDEGQLIVDKTIAHYGLQGLRLCVGGVPPNAAAAFDNRQNLIILGDQVLDSDHWMSVLAHELGHAVIKHDMPIRQSQHIEASSDFRNPTLDIKQQHEIDADRKGVEIMTKVVGMPEREATRRMAAKLLAINASFGGRAVAVSYPHIHPCDRFDKLIAAFPREWSDDLSCQKQQEPSRRGPALPTDAFMKLTRPSSSTSPASPGDAPPRSPAQRS